MFLNVPTDVEIVLQLIFALTVIVGSGIIYVRTREIYALTESQSLKLFRNSFLLFALAYTIKLPTNYFILSYVNVTSSIPFFILSVAFIYFSSLAIFYLLLSTSYTYWKEKKLPDPIASIHFTAFFVVLLTLFDSLALVFLVEFILFLIVTFVCLKSLKKNKGKLLFRAASNMYLVFFMLYLLSILLTRVTQSELVRNIVLLASTLLFMEIVRRVLKALKGPRK
ncbi:hypothetical protein H6501_03135 [Candidatus Woesearchaeota archaeon]|nr:hypothetical protein [Candidatus Woesearchaeota archaeon]USN43647.1 MAG: hypothetical protein H6500_04620 [Candidatus Woesearchaeota archaeon]